MKEFDLDDGKTTRLLEILQKNEEATTKESSIFWTKSDAAKIGEVREEIEDQISEN